MCELFMQAKESRLKSGELSERTFGQYYAACSRMVAILGGTRAVESLAPEDFAVVREKLAETRGAVALGVEIQRMKTVFAWAYREEHIERPARYGASFDKPSRKTIRIARAAKGVRMFEPDEIAALLKKASPQLAAMILLGCNAGLGQSDCANLPIDAIDFRTGWLDYPRPKTGIPRRVPLWKETLAAIKKAIAVRPEPKDEADAGLAFITKYGHRWVRVRLKESGKVAAVDAVGLEFRKLKAECGINGNRAFYALRHGFETVASGTRDQAAVNAIMGHVDESMSAVYRERIDDARLVAVVDHVHAWLYPPKPKKARRKGGAK